MSPDWQAFWISWRFDLGLLLLVVLSGGIYLRGWLRLRARGAARFGPWQLAAMLGGLLALFLALQSPLEAFSGLLLQIHMLQHLLLMFIAPPLLWLSAPELPLLVGLPRPLRRRVAVPLLRDEGLRMLTHALTHPLVAWLLFVVAAWVWHLPALYTRALTSTFWHEAEHATFFFAALCFWHVVIAPYPHLRRTNRWVVLPFLLLAGLQGTALSALLTFSDRVLYPHYLTVPRLWNITALDDQAVAGALMWSCGSLVYLVALVLVADRNLERPTSIPSRTGQREWPTFNRALAGCAPSHRGGPSASDCDQGTLGSSGNTLARKSSASGGHAAYTAKHPIGRCRADRFGWPPWPTGFAGQSGGSSPLDSLARRVGTEPVGGRQFFLHGLPIHTSPVPCQAIARRRDTLACFFAEQVAGSGIARTFLLGV